MDNLLRLFRRPGSPAILCIDTMVRYGVRWSASNGLGMVDRHVFHPVRCYGHGYTTLQTPSQ
jgi:hypothetical protein